MYLYKKIEILPLEHIEYQNKIKEHNTRVLLKWIKKSLKIALVVLDAAKSRFPNTKEFIDDTLKEECKKEEIIAGEVSFYKFRSKGLAWKNIFVLGLYYSDYFLFVGVERCGR